DELVLLVDQALHLLGGQDALQDEQLAQVLEGAFGGQLGLLAEGVVDLVGRREAAGHDRLAEELGLVDRGFGRQGAGVVGGHQLLELIGRDVPQLEEQLGDGDLGLAGLQEVEGAIGRAAVDHLPLDREVGDPAVAVVAVSHGARSLPAPRPPRRTNPSRRSRPPAARPCAPGPGPARRSPRPPPGAPSPRPGDPTSPPPAGSRLSSGSPGPRTAAASGAWPGSPCRPRPRRPAPAGAEARPRAPPPGRAPKPGCAPRRRSRSAGGPPARRGRGAGPSGTPGGRPPAGRRPPNAPPGPARSRRWRPGVPRGPAAASAGPPR